MSDLNLNFDTGSKSVVINSISEANGSTGGGITTSNQDTTSSGPTATPNVAPNVAHGLRQFSSNSAVILHHYQRFSG